MKIIRGNCGHIKARWDNHLNCLSCSSCSRLSTCSVGSNWSENTGILVVKKRTYSSRTSVMTKKRPNKQKKQIVVSDPSDDKSVDGNTTPQGFTARVRTHPGGFLMGAIGTQTVLSPPVTNHQSTRHWSTSHQSASHWAIFHRSTRQQARFHRPARHRSTRHQSSDTRHQAPVTGHPVTCHSRIFQFIDNASIAKA